jgi:phosphate butyryltransferase
MQSTVDAASIVEQYQAGRIKGCIVDGPFAIDNLVSVVSSVHKGILSPVGGWCDLMVFPTIELEMSSIKPLYIWQKLMLRESFSDRKFQLCSQVAPTAAKQN